MRDIFDASFVTIHGDINRADAIELAEIARESTSILEFGVGGSTYIIHQNLHMIANILHIETEKFWIEHVEAHLPKIVPEDIYNPSFNFDFFHVDTSEVEKAIENKSCDLAAFDFIKHCPIIKTYKPFDFIFVDGVVELRYAFFMQVWDYLGVGGKIVLHDCKAQYTNNIVSMIVQQHWAEIDNISLGKNGSNLAVFTKGHPKVYYDWNYTESENNRDNIALEQKLFVKQETKE